MSARVPTDLTGATGWGLNEAETALVERTQDFARESVVPTAADRECARASEMGLMRAAASFGLTAIQVPVERGGLGFSFRTKAAVGEALAAADFGFAMAVLNTHNIAQRLTRDVAPEIAERYLDDLLTARRTGCTALTEPGAGSDFGAIETRAERIGGGWRLTGAKTWIINAVHADVIVIYAQTAPGSGGRGIASFLIDATLPGFVRSDPIALPGQHSIGAGGFRLDGFVAPDEMVIHPAGNAFLSALTDINGARIYVGAMCCGMVAACLDYVADYGVRRHTFGTPLSGHQGWRWRLAEAEADLAATRALVQSAARRIDAGSDAQAAAARAKVVATRMAERHIASLAQLMGAEGLRQSWPFSRHQAGARVASFTDGATEILLERISRRYRPH